MVLSNFPDILKVLIVAALLGRNSVAILSRSLSLSSRYVESAIPRILRQQWLTTSNINKVYYLMTYCIGVVNNILMAGRE
ncbi:hypothetical protein P8452_05986 [Trifolium repens]|nr:hypothetical protein P8452_05986 [Trifolium repens]